MENKYNSEYSDIDGVDPKPQDKSLIPISNSDASFINQEAETRLGYLIEELAKENTTLPLIDLPNESIFSEALQSVTNSQFQEIREQFEGINNVALEATRINENWESILKACEPISTHLDVLRKTGREITENVMDQFKHYNSLRSVFELPESLSPKFHLPEIEQNMYSSYPSFLTNLPAYDQPEPLPSGGTLCTSFIVVQGLIEQVAEVLDDEFSKYKSPSCHLVSHEDKNYWHIDIFEGDEEEANDILMEFNKEDVEAFEEYIDARGKWEEKTSRIGYVQISNRPRIPVRFYLFDIHHNEIIRSLANDIANELLQWQFEIDGMVSSSDTKEHKLPNPLGSLDTFSSFEVMETVDGLKGLIRSYLQSMGLVPESQSVRDTYRADDRLRIEYPIESCLVVMNVKVNKPGFTQIRPEILSWVDNQKQRTQKIDQIKPHLQDLIKFIKQHVKWAPIEPTSTDLEDWFAYYHECKTTKIKYHLSDIAKELHLSVGHVRNKHSEYLAEHGP